MERKKSYQTFFFALFLILFLIIIGLIYHRKEVNEIREETYSNLTALAEVKERQIDDWLRTQINHCELAAISPFYGSAVEQVISKKSFGKLLNEFKVKHESLVNYNDYDDAILITADKKAIFSIWEKQVSLDKIILDSIDKVINTSATVVTDFYESKTHSKIQMDILSPVFNENGKVIAILDCPIDPNKFLFPLIQLWPTKTKSAETLLVEMEKDSVVFLNKLRHVNNTPLKLKFSLGEKNIAAVQAVTGKTGIYDGIDYRGKEVLTDLRKIEGINWYLVTKIDKDEIFSNLSYRTISFYLILFLVISLVALFAFLLYRSKQKDHFKRLYENEKELNTVHQEFKTALYSIGDGVICTDVNGIIKQMNSVAEKLTGWSENDASHIHVDNVFKIISETDRKQVESPVKKVLEKGLIVGLANHTLLISKDGTEIPIADSGAPITDENGNILGVVLVFRDQTEERNSQKAIEDNAERFISLFNNMNEGVALHEVIFDDNNKPINYRIVDINPRYEEILGLKRNSTIGKLATELYGTSEPPYFSEFCRVAVTGEITQLKTYFPPMNKHFEISVAPWLNNGFATIFTDITERVKADEEIRLREEQLSITLNSIGDGVISTDTKGKVTHLNPVAEHLTGWKNDEAIGQPLDNIFNIVNAETREPAFNPVDKVLTEGIIVGLANHTVLIDKDGIERQIADSAAPIRNKDGRIVGVVLVFSDVTKQYEVLHKLRESERLLRESQAVAEIGSYVLDIKTGFWKSSKTLDDIFGIDEKFEKNVSGWGLMIHPEWLDIMMNHLLVDVIGEKGQFNKEYKIIRMNDKVERWVHGYGELEFDNDNNPIRMIGTIQDVTDITNARLELEAYKNNLEEMIKERTAQLDEVNQRLIEEIHKQKEYELLLQDSLVKEKEIGDLKTRFISTVSHEFRTPLMSIQLSVDLLQRHFNQNNQEKFNVQIGSIKNSIVNLSKLLDDILTINRTESGKIKCEPIQMNLKNAIEQIIIEAAVYKQPNHELEFHYKSNREEFFLDPKLIKYIVLNLLSNAYKYSPAGGKISVTLDHIEEIVQIKIADNGIGFCEYQPDLIYEPFFRCKNALDIPGTGLGLSIVKKAVDLHAGKIDFTSEPGGGTEFYVRLPILNVKSNLNSGNEN